MIKPGQKFSGYGRCTNCSDIHMRTVFQWDNEPYWRCECIGCGQEVDHGPVAIGFRLLLDRIYERMRTI